MTSPPASRPGSRTIVDSPEKLREQLDRIEGFSGDEDASPTVRMAASWLIMLRPRLEPMIPQDPGELDQLLEALSHWALAMRSDVEALTA